MANRHRFRTLSIGPPMIRHQKPKQIKIMPATMLACEVDSTDTDMIPTDMLSKAYTRKKPKHSDKRAIE